MEWATAIAAGIGERSGEPATPRVSDGTVVVGHSDGLDAFDAGNGADRWTVSMGDNSYVSPTIVNSTVYTGSARGFHAFSLDGGSERWAATAESLPMTTLNDLSTARAPVGVHGWLFAATANYVLSLDAAGSLRWWADSAFSSPLEAPLATNGEDVFVTRGGQIGSFDLPIDPWQGPLDTDHRVPKDTGRRWHPYVEANGGPLAGDSLVYQPVYFGNDYEHGSLLALERDDGSQRWSFETAGEGPSASLAHGTVFVGDSRGELDALDATSGKERWVETVSTPEWEYTATEPKAGRNGVVATGEEIVHYGLDGTERWRLSPGARPLLSTVLTDGRLYVLTGHNEPEGYLDYELRCYA